MVRSLLLAAMCLLAAAVAACTVARAPLAPEPQVNAVSEPQAFSLNEFLAHPAKYSNEFVEVNGEAEALVEYSRIIVPAYSVHFPSTVRHLVVGPEPEDLSREPAGTLKVSVGVETDAVRDVLQQVVNESHRRFLRKMDQAGLEVMDLGELQSNPDFAEYFAGKFGREPASDPSVVTVLARGTGHLKTANHVGATLSLSRALQAAVVMPVFHLSFGHFEGGRPTTIVEKIGPFSVEFTPEVSVTEGSGANWFAKFFASQLQIRHPLISRQVFFEGFSKPVELRSPSKASESILDGTDRRMQLNLQKFKMAALEQLDIMESLILARYQAEL